MTNAFPSPNFDEMGKPLEKRLQQSNHELFQQRRRNQVTVITARDGSIEIRLGSGGMQGDGNAPDEFMDTFHKAVHAWQSDKEEYRHIKPLVARLRWDKSHSYNASLVTFVDDILKFYIIPTGQAKEAVQIVKESDNNLNFALDRIELRQNESKQEAIAHFVDWHQGRIMTEKKSGFLGKCFHT